MASRFPITLHTDYCYQPVRISKNGITMYVPCGKCNGCLLQKANSWSFRLGDEIENANASSIFFTLTYDNRYVPKMECRVEDGQFHWFSAKNNVRFNGHYDVLREPLDFYSPFHVVASLKNYHDGDVVGYLCKKDIQLYLKLLRKSIYENFNISAGSFRYYIIGEYGPGKNPHQGKYRPHYHGVITPCNSEVKDYLLESALYACWQMCDKSRFEQYTKCCDSGARHYVTEYVTGITYLPKIYTETKEIKPFSLCSKKDGTIGTRSFDRKEVLQEIERGTDTFVKRVSRIERSYLFLYPKTLTDSLFPKCSRFNLLSFNGLLRIYEYLYLIREVGYDVASLSDVFFEFNSQSFSQQDYIASKRCLDVCDLMGWRPFHYVEVLVDFYYRKAMRALRYQYEYQEENIREPYKCISWYQNSWTFCEDSFNFQSPMVSVFSARHNDSVRWFLQSFGLDGLGLDKDKFNAVIDNADYITEVDDIISNADKSKKVNALVGQSPHIV